MERRDLGELPLAEGGLQLVLDEQPYCSRVRGRMSVRWASQRSA